MEDVGNPSVCAANDSVALVMYQDRLHECSLYGHSHAAYVSAAAQFTCTSLTLAPDEFVDASAKSTSTGVNQARDWCLCIHGSPNGTMCIRMGYVLWNSLSPPTHLSCS